MKRFLGWDCANRTLAWSYLDIDTHIYSKLSILADELVDLLTLYLGSQFIIALERGLDDDSKEMLSMTLQDEEFMSSLMFIVDVILYFTDNFLQYISAGVVDTLKGKKTTETTEISRTRALHQFLTNHAHISTIRSDTTVIIEHQPARIGTNTNSKSTAVSQQLAFYYITHTSVFIDPKLKNKISLGANLTFDRFLADEIPKHKSLRDAKYAARKIHSRENFLFLLSAFNLENITENISRAVMDDLADSTMQILAYLVENKLFT